MGKRQAVERDYGELIACGCGCGEMITEYGYKKCGLTYADGDIIYKRYERRFKRGHSSRVKIYKDNYEIDCACGCGSKLMRLDDHCRPRKFLPGHQIRVLDIPKYPKGNIPWNKGEKGVQTAWNKGKPHLVGDKNPAWRGGKIEINCGWCDRPFMVSPYAVIPKKWQPNKGETSRKYCSRECMASAYRVSGSFVGESNPNWHGGTTSENAKIRNSPEYMAWRISVFTRDNYTCQLCGIRGGDLIADHYPYAFYKYPDKRLDINNGRSLCKDCNYQVTHVDRLWAKSPEELGVVV